MIVFVDESGIHKQVDHSVFALVYIQVEDRLGLEKGVVRLEKMLNIKEFHWADQGWKVREKFIVELSRLDFTAKVAVFRNPINSAEALEWSLLHLLVDGEVEQIHIDGNKPKWVESKFKKVLRDKGVTVRRLRTERHVSSPGIRVADAIAGLSRAYYDKKSQKAEKLWEIASKKIAAHLMGGQAYK